MSWFTGEAIQEDEFGDIEDDDEDDDVEEDDDDEEEDDEEEDDDDDDEEEDEEESKPKKKVGILLMWPDFILFIILLLFLFLKLMLIIICHIVLGCCGSRQPDTRCVTSFPVSFISIIDYLSPQPPIFLSVLSFSLNKEYTLPKIILSFISLVNCF